jgi:hypothetical protein
VDRSMALKIAQSPANVDRTLWLYELCRFLIQKVNSIITALFADDPPCSSLTCPEMRASEWQYLCAVHDPPKSCCAIDYCCHTLDWAANTLTSPKHFPSRLALGTDQSTQHSQMRQLTNIFRRVYRIFAHAWYSHREVFWKVEGRTGLYIFYKTVCDVYGLVPEDNYTIPPEAEGIEPSTEAKPSAPPLIMKREPSDSSSQISVNTLAEGMSDHTLSTAGTTKRHRHSPSVGATIVQTVVEENEEEEERPSLQSRPVTQIFESPQGEEEHEDGDSDGDITAIEDNEEEDDDDEDEDEDEDEAESVPEISPPEAKDATDEAAKQGASEEEVAGTSPEKEEKQDTDVAAEPASTETAEVSSKDAQDTEKESSQDDAEADKDDSKPDTADSEQVKKPDSAAKPSEEGEPKAKD